MHLRDDNKAVEITLVLMLQLMLLTWGYIMAFLDQSLLSWNKKLNKVFWISHCFHEIASSFLHCFHEIKKINSIFLTALDDSEIIVFVSSKWLFQKMEIRLHNALWFWEMILLTLLNFSEHFWGAYISLIVQDKLRFLVPDILLYG